MVGLGRHVTPVQGRIYTNEFRLYGRIHMPEAVGTARMLNLTDRPYLPVTDCMVFDAGFRHPPEHDALQYETAFAAVPKEHIMWIVGGRGEDPSEHARRVTRQVYIMYANYVLSGRLFLMPGQRVSDFLHTVFTDRPFQDLYGARVLLPKRDVHLEEFEVLQFHEFVTVNLKQAGGVFDVGNGAGNDGGDGFRLEENEI